MFINIIIINIRKSAAEAKNNFLFCFNGYLKFSNKFET